MKLTHGALAGLVATVPMTIAMKEMFNHLPERDQFPLPPRHITLNIADKLNIREKLGEQERNIAVAVSHFGYGSAMGALYALVEKKLPGPPLVKGITFGLGVWAGNYLAALPATGLLTSARKHSSARTSLMIAAHLIWGTTVALASKGSSNP